MLQTKIACFIKKSSTSIHNAPYVLDWHDLGDVTILDTYFSDACFTRNSLINWDVSNVVGMIIIFSWFKYNRSLTNWNVANVIDIGTSEFNHPYLPHKIYMIELLV